MYAYLSKRAESLNVENVDCQRSVDVCLHCVSIGWGLAGILLLDMRMNVMIIGGNQTALFLTACKAAIWKNLQQICFRRKSTQPGNWSTPRGLRMARKSKSFCLQYINNTFHFL